MPRSRYDEPDHCLGATAFSKTTEVLDPLWVVAQLRALPVVWKPLRKAIGSELKPKPKLAALQGRPRAPGHWELAYLTFVVSDAVDIHPWWAKSPRELWRACGFEERPSYPACWLRFTEFERCSDAFRRAANQLIRHACKHEPRIASHLHTDATEAETHAALIHDCPPDAKCMSPDGGRRAERGRRAARVKTVYARKDRTKAAELPEEEAERLLSGGIERVVETERGKRLRIGGHWYLSRDASAGARAYTGPHGATRFWHGYYNHKLISHFIGAPVAVGLFSASEQEYDSYPTMLRRGLQATGDLPQSVVADKGLAIERVYRLHTRLGIASVMPWRGSQFGMAKDQERFDRHGVVRCKHCGGETAMVRFSERPSPRLWVRCLLEITDACERVQTVSCSAGWRYLLPLWRTDRLYKTLEASHSRYERVHDLWRDRYKVGPDDLAMRPKRPGILWQELRAQAALLAEWLRICALHGWLGSVRRVKRLRPRRDPEAERAPVKVAQLHEERHHARLHEPYGDAAVELGVGKARPPTPKKKS
ncbi:MAG TPA: hypothetical protein VNT32_11740 [Thermoleophilaceae bacterium]|nr:hypothetical protein [Thermoleophilaceae bacterium]